MDIYSLKLILDGLAIDSTDVGKIQWDSYYSWSIDEFYFFVMESLYPNKQASVDEYLRITANFKKRMHRFSKVQPKNNYMFVVAEAMTTDVIDILHAMKEEYVL